MNSIPFGRATIFLFIILDKFFEFFSFRYECYSLFFKFLYLSLVLHFFFVLCLLRGCLVTGCLRRNHHFSCPFWVKTTCSNACYYSWRLVRRISNCWSVKIWCFLYPSDYIFSKYLGCDPSRLRSCISFLISVCNWSCDPSCRSSKFNRIPWQSYRSCLIRGLVVTKLCI